MRNRQHQHGVVLFIALIILVAMTLAGIALVRSVDTNNIISGNLAFKQSSLLAADRGIQAAFVWLNENRDKLSKSNLGEGYFSSIAGDFTGFGDTDWDNAKQVGEGDNAGNTVEYVIHRLCSQPDTPPNGNNGGVSNQCSTLQLSAVEDGSKKNDAPIYNSIPVLIYRVTTRVRGPRNTVSITQATITGPI